MWACVCIGGWDYKTDSKVQLEEEIGPNHQEHFLGILREKLLANIKILL